MPGTTQLGLLSSGPAQSVNVHLRVNPTGTYVWGRIHTRESSGLERVTRVPRIEIMSGFLGLPDDMRDIFTAWLYHGSGEIHRLAKEATESWVRDWNPDELRSTLP